MVTTAQPAAITTEAVAGVVQLIGDVKLFPNPTKGLAQLEFIIPANVGTVEMVLLDVTGREVQSYSWGKVEQETMASHVIDATDCFKGVYLVRLTTGTGEQLVKRLVVE